MNDNAEVREVLDRLRELLPRQSRLPAPRIRLTETGGKRVYASLTSGPVSLSFGILSKDRSLEEAPHVGKMVEEVNGLLQEIYREFDWG